MDNCSWMISLNISDLHTRNILSQFPEVIDHFLASELYKIIGDSESDTFIRIDRNLLSRGVLAYIYVPAWFGVRSDDLILGEEKIIISDYGESFNPHKIPKSSSKTLPIFQPPEARFSENPFSFTSDIRTLACTIWQIFDQRPLF